MSKFIVIGRKAVRADHVSVVQGLDANRSKVMMVDGTWLEAHTPLQSLVDLLDSRLAE